MEVVMTIKVSKGDIYGKLEIIKEVEPRQYPNLKVRQFLCKCECGNKVKVILRSLRTGDTKSCGCFRRDFTTKSKTIHGLSKHPLYMTWLNMKARCYDKTHVSYDDYGGRGITICKQWLGEVGLECFIADMDKLPKDEGWFKGSEIDRKNNEGNYEPGNVWFVNRSDNLRNRRNTVWVDAPIELTDKEFESIKHLTRVRDGYYEMLLIDLWELKGSLFDYGTVFTRVAVLGWNPWDAVMTPVRRMRRIT
jgi:hypothetical protein